MLSIFECAARRASCLVSRTSSTLPKRNIFSRSLSSYVDPADDLSFVAITPRSLAKGRAGVIMARLLSTPGISIVGARMYAPSDAFTEKYVSILRNAGHAVHYSEALIEFVKEDLRFQNCITKGYPNRLLALFFTGKNTREKIIEVVGQNLPPPSDYGRTIRGSYGDYAIFPDGTVHDFQPAVLAPRSRRTNRETLALFAEFAESDGGVMKQISTGTSIETGLVMIKPDNLERASALPGHIIDMFGATGLHIVATRVFSMSVEQGLRFYGFLEDVFKDKLAPKVDAVLRQRLAGAFDFSVTDDELTKIVDLLRTKNAHSEVNKIIKYMTGLDPDTVPLADRHRPGPAKCFALLYRGPSAISIIRSRLGTTDPSKAAAGTIRSDYGHDMMKNGAHASDSTASADRERRIVGLVGDEPSSEKQMIEQWLRETAARESV